MSILVIAASISRTVSLLSHINKFWSVLVVLKLIGSFPFATRIVLPIETIRRERGSVLSSIKRVLFISGSYCCSHLVTMSIISASVSGVGLKTSEG